MILISPLMALALITMSGGQAAEQCISIPPLIDSARTLSLISSRHVMLPLETLILSGPLTFSVVIVPPEERRSTGPSIFFKLIGLRAVDLLTTNPNRRMAYEPATNIKMVRADVDHASAIVLSRPMPIRSIFSIQFMRAA